ncbi:MAG: hypothetical protein ACK53L_04945 [Pirellulaceae bacterium]
MAWINVAAPHLLTAQQCPEEAQRCDRSAEKAMRRSSQAMLAGLQTSQG